jgi:hypothetical protein
MVLDVRLLRKSGRSAAAAECLLWALAVSKRFAVRVETEKRDAS